MDDEQIKEKWMQYSTSFEMPKSSLENPANYLGKVDQKI